MFNHFLQHFFCRKLVASAGEPDILEDREITTETMKEIYYDSTLNISSQDFEKPSKLNIRLSCSENNLQENNSSYNSVDLSDVDF